MYLKVKENTMHLLTVGCQCENPGIPLLKEPGLKLSNEIKIFLCLATDKIQKLANWCSNEMIKRPR